MSSLSRALGVITAAGLLGTSLLASPALAADQDLTVSPSYANNSSASDTTLTLSTTGSGMATGASVKLTLHGTAITITNSNSQTATAAANGKSVSVPLTLTHTDPGVYDALVTNPTGGNTYACTSCFTVTSSAPTVTSFARTSNSGSNPATFTITGTNFALNSKVAFAPTGTTTADPNVTWATTTATTTGSTFKGSLTIASAALGGTYDVIVTNYDGKKGTCAGCLVVPKFTSVVRSDKPAQVPAQLGYGVTHKTLVVSGVGLSATTSFGFSAINGDTNNIVVNSRTYDAATGKVTLDVSVTENVGTFDVNDTTVSQPYQLLTLSGVGGGYYKASPVLIVNPRPEFDTSNNGYYFDKDNPGVSQQHFLLTVHGSGFQPGMTAAFTPADGITVSSVTPSGDGTTAVVDMNLAASTPITAHDVLLQNPDLGVPSAGVQLTPSAAPVITSASPADVNAGTTSVTITLSGSGISTQTLREQEATKTPTPPATTANYDYNARQIVFLDHLGEAGWGQTGSASGSGSSVTATVNLPASAPAGPYRIGFLDHNGSLVECKTASGGACFTLDSLGVSAVSPNLVTNDGPATLTVTGAGFVAGATVRLTKAGQPDIVGTNVRNLTGTSLTADFQFDGVSPQNHGWTVRVTNPDGSTGALNGGLTVAGGSPSITSISPTSIAAGQSAAVLTVNGTELARGATLTFSGLGQTGPTVVSSTWVSRTKMTFVLNTVGATTTVPRTVVLTNTDGNATPSANCTACLTITAAPTLSGTPISPASRAAGSPTYAVTVNGTGFNGKPTVAFDGSGITTGTSTLGAGGTSFTIPVTVAPGAALTVRSFTVTNGDGGQVSCSSCFTVLAPPTVTGVSPAVQKRGTGPTTVTISGTHFNSGGASVAFSGTGITTGTVTVVNATTITVPVTVAAGATPLGAHDVTVTNTPATDGGAATLTGAFSIGDVPGVPQSLTATRGDSLVNLAWAAPASDGGLPVTGYTVTVVKAADSSAVPGAVVTVSGTTAQVTGLTNGTAYAFAVKATNAAGSGAATAPVSATPATLPGAPTGASAAAGDKKATVSWTAPASNGGDPITSYEVFFAPSGASAGTTSGTSLVVSGLTNGTAYAFYVVAKNSVGSSDQSSTTAPVTPLQSVPDAPTGLTASVTAASGEVDLSWTAPPANTLTAVTSYNVSVSPASGTNVGTTSYPVDRTATTATVTGLTNGIVYTFTVKAVNGGGTSPASAPATGKPYGKPGAVASLVGSAGNQTVSASWAPPASDGGSPVTGYTATLTPGNVTKTGTATSASFTGLTNGVQYTISVVATNARGDGPAGTVQQTPTPANAALTLTSSAAKVLRGQHVVLKGVLTRPDTSVPAGSVTLKVINDQGVVSTVATVTPAADGSYSYDFAPTYNGTYRAYYAGDSRNGATTSGTARVLVAVRISATTATGPATTTATVKGSVLPNKSGQVLTLYRVNSNGTLTRLATTRANSSSQYAFRIKLSKGNHLLQVGMADTPGNAHGEVRFVAKRT